MILASFGPDATVELRDIFVIVQKGKPIGEAMVIKVEKGRVTLLPKAVKGTPGRGDVLKFARHTEVPVDGTESWKVFNGPSFSVSLPSPPSGPKTETSTAERGSKVDTSEWTSVDRADETIYVVDVSVYHLARLGANERWADSERSLQLSLDHLERERGAKLQWSKPVRQGDIPGREFELSVANGVNIRGRMFLDVTTFYVALAITKDKSASSRSFKFLNSFTITKKPQGK